MNNDELNHSQQWARFLSLLHQDRRINPKARPHHARWVDRWLREQGPESEELTRRFFEALCRKPGLKDWQFQQAVFSVELWSRQVETPAWADDFDWRAIADRAASLEDDHPTRLRDAVPVSHPDLTEEAVQERDRTPVEGEKEIVEGILEKARRAIRADGKAPATERTYLGWIRKFTYFRLRRIRESVEALPADSVNAYLN